MWGAQSLLRRRLGLQWAQQRAVQRGRQMVPPLLSALPLLLEPQSSLLLLLASQSALPLRVRLALVPQSQRHERSVNLLLRRHWRHDVCTSACGIRAGSPALLYVPELSWLPSLCFER